MEPRIDDSSEANRWTLPVDEDGVLCLPDELLKHLGWEEGDELEWIDQEDDSFILRKLTQDESI